MPQTTSTPVFVPLDPERTRRHADRCPPATGEQLGDRFRSISGRFRGLPTGDPWTQEAMCLLLWGPGTRHEARTSSSLLDPPNQVGTVRAWRLDYTVGALGRAQSYLRFGGSIHRAPHMLTHVLAGQGLLSPGFEPIATVGSVQRL